MSDRALLLVRHAVALARHKWDEDDDLRPLTRRGEAQAKALVPALAGFAVDRVLSSPSVRCTDTVRPLAQVRQVALEEATPLAEGYYDQARELVESLAGDAVVLCTHGDVVPEVLGYLARHHGLRLGPRPTWAKGSTWVLHAEGGQFVEAAYLDPPA